ALAVQAAGQEVLTVRGLGTPEAPHPLQAAFVEAGAAQCGICIPGMLVSLYAFLRVHPRADRQAVREAIGGNLCRCTGYHKIVDAALAANCSGPPAPLPPSGGRGSTVSVPGSVAAADSGAPPPFRIVGGRVPRPDAKDKVHGLLRYADDFALAGMLHAKVV